MKICFDLRPLQIGHENRGIGMFAKSVLEHLPKDSNEYLFYMFDDSNPVEKLGLKLNFDYSIVTTKRIKTAVDTPSDIFGMLRLVNHHFHPLKAFKPDVFLQFDFQLGTPRWRGIKNIVIGYDLIPLVMKNEYLPNVRFAWQHSAGKRSKIRAVLRSVYYRTRFHFHYRVFRKADKIICISDSTAKSFNELLGIDRSRMKTIYLAPVLSKESAPLSIVSKLKKPYLFYVGGTDDRKGIQDIVYAYNIARGRGLDIALVLAGNEFKDIKMLPNVKGRSAILASPYKKDIHLVGFVNDAQKRSLYENAFAFLFCSSYEGFGMPILEAMASGCPVISYTNSSIPEAAGNAALPAKTNDYTAVAQAILELQAPELRDKLVKKGLAQSKKFNWQIYVKHFLSVLNA